MTVRGPGRAFDAVVDFRNPYFIGLRTDRALTRVFGRNHWGHPVGISLHDFAPDADIKECESRLAGLAERGVQPVLIPVAEGYGWNRSTCGSWSLIWSLNSELMCTLSYSKSQPRRIDGLTRIWSRTCWLPW